MWHAHDGMGWWMLFAVLLWLLLVGLVAWIVTVLARGSNSQSRTTRKDDALAIARSRYAAGEIDRESFEQIRRDLEGGSHD